MTIDDAGFSEEFKHGLKELYLAGFEAGVEATKKHLVESFESARGEDPVTPGDDFDLGYDCAISGAIEAVNEVALEMLTTSGT